MLIQEFLYSVLTEHGQIEMPSLDNVIVCNAYKCFNGCWKGEHIALHVVSCFGKMTVQSRSSIGMAQRVRGAADSAPVLYTEKSVGMQAV